MSKSFRKATPRGWREFQGNLLDWRNPRNLGTAMQGWCQWWRACARRARAQGDTCQRASSRPPPHPRLRRRPEPERARLRHPRPVPDRGAPDAPRPPAGALARLQHYPTRRPGLRVPVGRSAWPPPCPACADGRPGHRGPLLSHPTRTPDPLPGAHQLVPLDGALAPLC